MKKGVGKLPATRNLLPISKHMQIHLPTILPFRQGKASGSWIYFQKESVALRWIGPSSFE